MAHLVPRETTSDTITLNSAVMIEFATQHRIHYDDFFHAPAVSRVSIA